MRSHQRNRLITVLIALFSLLFMQLAVASYVCPGSGSAAASITAPTPCAGDMMFDKDEVALCHAHCKVDQQSLEKTPAHVPIDISSVGIAYPARLVVVDRLNLQGYLPSQSHATAPPLAIRNCCLRI